MLADRIAVHLRGSRRGHRGRSRRRHPRDRTADDRWGGVTITLETREGAPRWLSPLATILAVVVALVIGGVVLWFVGGDPIRAYRHIFEAAFGSVGVISDTLVKATPLIFTGLACALAFRMRLWNIGAEGQFLLGAWGACAVVLVPILPAGTPASSLIPAMMLAGAAAGGAVGRHPGLAQGALRRQRDHHHPDAQLHRHPWVQFWVFGPWSEGGFQQIRARSRRTAWLPRLTDFAERDPGLRRPDRPSRADLRGPGRAAIVWLVVAQAHALGLRDPAHRRQPAGGPLRGHRHRTEDHRGLRDVRARWRASPA